jgi:hypothetical protein
MYAPTLGRVLDESGTTMGPMNESTLAPETVQRPRRGGPDPVFTASFRFQEDPAVLKELEALASRSGHSIAAEIRSAVRYWIAATG